MLRAAIFFAGSSPTPIPVGLGVGALVTIGLVPGFVVVVGLAVRRKSRRGPGA